jgi:hypothetical protein
MLLAGAPAASAQLLLPDLQTEPFGAIRLCQESLTADDALGDSCTGTGRTVVRIANRVGDHGSGPIELVPDPTAPLVGCPSDVPADQEITVDERIYLDANADGVFERPTDTAYTDLLVGCKYYHAEHHHYHFEDYARFFLYSETTGQLVVSGNKTSFCLLDTNHFDLSLPGAPSSKYYSSATCKSLTGLDGTSVGWYDGYGSMLPGQELDVTGLPAGIYCLVSVADPDNKLTESDDSNNTRELRIRFDPSQAPVNSYARARKLSGPCTFGA